MKQQQQEKYLTQDIAESVHITHSDNKPVTPVLQLA